MSKPLFNNADALAEQERQEFLKASAPVQRGIQAALAQELANVRAEFAARVTDVRKAALRRDTNQQSRDAYDRCWKKCLKCGERLKSIVENEDVSMPDWLAPPAPGEEKTLSIGVPKISESYRECAGKSPDGTGLPPPPIPGSAADHSWLERGGK